MILDFFCEQKYVALGMYINFFCKQEKSTKIHILISNNLVPINGKLQDIIWHPLKTVLGDQDPRPLTKKCSQTNSTKNAPQTKSETQKE